MLGWCRQQGALQMGSGCWFNTGTQRLRMAQHPCTKDDVFTNKEGCRAEALQHHAGGPASRWKR